jgi:hypothetical protein
LGDTDREQPCRYPLLCTQQDQGLPGSGRLGFAERLERLTLASWVV